MFTPNLMSSNHRHYAAPSLVSILKKIACLLAVALFALSFVPALAKSEASSSDNYRTVTTESWVEEWDALQCQWVKVGDSQFNTRIETLSAIAGAIANGAPVLDALGDARDTRPSTPKPSGAALGRYGPFLVTTPMQAIIVGATNVRSPQDFDAMLRDFPGISSLSMVEAPGTTHDIANLVVGRKIRASGISTHVPQNGSVRSGAVELFLAGVARSIDDGAMFAVHSWRDYNGREPNDFANDHPANRLYLDYYVEMGMSERGARDFYNMTNSVPHSSALWLRADDMRHWLPAASRQIASQCRSRILPVKANRAWHRHFSKPSPSAGKKLSRTALSQFAVKYGPFAKAKLFNAEPAAPSP